MTFTSFMIGVALVFIVFLLFVLFMTPVSPEEKEKRKWKKKKDAEELVRKDWEAVARRYQEQVVSLHQKIEALENKEKDFQKQIVAESEKLKIVQEKADRERGWFEREKKIIEKKSEEIDVIKESLKSAQEEINQKHLVQVRIERELKESKREADNVAGIKHHLDLEIMELKAKQAALEEAIAGLKRQNKDLTKKDADLNWISVSDYDKLKKLYHESEREVRELKTQLKLLKEDQKKTENLPASPASEIKTASLDKPEGEQPSA